MQAWLTQAPHWLRGVSDEAHMSGARAIVECLDSSALAAAEPIQLPTFGDWLQWELRGVEPRAPLRRATIVFVAAGENLGGDVARRVAWYRAEGLFALGIYPSDNVDVAPLPGVIRLALETWKADLSALLPFVVAPLGEGLPEIIACLDWHDVARALRAPGELLFAWASTRTNSHAFRKTFGAITKQLAGRRCMSLLCLLRGGKYSWFKELRAAISACRDILLPDGVILGGDAIAPFGVHAGCCILAVAASRSSLCKQ